MALNPFDDDRFYPPRNFANLEPEFSAYASARVAVLPVPYDSTTTARAGAREGPMAIIDASADMELFDLVLERETFRAGITTLPEVAPNSDSPAAMIHRIQSVVDDLLDDRKFVVTLGGEHTVAVAPVRAHAARYDNLSVLAFDAHADMRPAYLDSEYNHACTLRRSLEAVGGVRQDGGRPRLVHVGLRSAERAEYDYLRDHNIPVFPAHRFRELANGPEQVAELLTDNVYVTIDIDCLDSAIMPAVGTPEPGGLTWWDVTAVLTAVTRRRRIVGFDITELAPDYGVRANAQLCAKLAYRALGLALRE
ncbi:MAG: agmatinase [Dehalococcoidia bacterium]